MRPAAASVIAILVLATGCRSDTPTIEVPAPRSTPSGATSTVTTTQDGSPAAQTGTATAAPAATSDPDARAKGRSTTAALDRGCIHQGEPSETQGLTVITSPGARIGYSSSYSDGSNELTNKSYTTGFGSGVAGPDGIFRASWVVPPAAPVGPATVHLISNKPIPRDIGFQIVAKSAPCP